MALETLLDVKEINGHQIRHLTRDQAMEEKENPFIIAFHDRNSLFLKIQNGPVKENGINGIQIDDIIQIVITMISGLNEKFPCEHNLAAMAALDAALRCLAERKIDRVQRDVEGTNQL